MWIFVYGSLMWKLDNLQPYIRSSKKAILHGLHRDFNKASIENWGTGTNPAPTLGLKRGDKCFGVAYEIDDRDRERVMAILEDREGKHFIIKEKNIEVIDHGKVRAFYPYNKRDSSFLGRKTLKKRAEMAIKASGKYGSCIDYVKNNLKNAEKLGIKDDDIKKFWEEISLRQSKKSLKS